MVLVLSFIGGGLGSGLTWLLYGFNFGTGVSAPYAVAIRDSFGIPEFYAQLIPDLLIDLADKTITVFASFFTVRLLPKTFLDRLPNGCLFTGLAEERDARIAKVRQSLRSKVVILISLSALVLSFGATWISYALYRDSMNKHFASIAANVAEMETGMIDGDEVRLYLSTLTETPGYAETEAELKNLRDSIKDVEYVYVYQVLEDGCHVVFDVDTPELEGGSLGDVVGLDEDFSPYMDELLAGEPIPPVISHGAYGWLLTAYEPVKDSSGVTVAYAAADISMEDVMQDRAIFVIKMISLLFGVSIIIVAFALWFAERQLVDPINAMAAAAADFAYDTETRRQETAERMQKLGIHTGDEIENLYGALRKTVTDMSAYISDISAKSEIIARIQHSMIISFANMVESRDLNTGEHIKHTAAYANVIAEEMLREGQFPEVINKDFVDKIVRSAPLHDLGKIKVPDAILNKPGKLTAEEFETIKQHTTAGRDILQGIISSAGDAEYFSEAVNMAAYHHERWDGGGYPEGLSGEEIPVAARIMAVADVYDALVSRRSYKEPMTDEQAFQIICGEAGTHFDPAVVEAFVNAHAKICQVTGQ